MEKDPEDVRYNFIRWLSNDIGTAIGPSRAHPETGEGPVHQCDSIIRPHRRGRARCPWDWHGCLGKWLSDL
jgi:hypothetical protein